VGVYQCKKDGGLSKGRSSIEIMSLEGISIRMGVVLLKTSK